MSAVFSRQAFLARSALLVGALAGVRAFSPSEAAPALLLAVEEPLKATAYVREFWIASTSDKPLEFVAMDGDDERLVYWISPHSTLFIQYPLGRRVQADRFVVNGEKVAFDAVGFKRVDFPQDEGKPPSMVFVTGTAVNCQIGAVWEEG